MSNKGDGRFPDNFNHFLAEQRGMENSFGAPLLHRLPEGLRPKIPGEPPKEENVFTKTKDEFEYKLRTRRYVIAADMEKNDALDEMYDKLAIDPDFYLRSETSSVMKDGSVVVVISYAVMKRTSVPAVPFGETTEELQAKAEDEAEAKVEGAGKEPKKRSTKKKAGGKAKKTSPPAGQNQN